MNKKAKREIFLRGTLARVGTSLVSALIVALIFNYFKKSPNAILGAMAGVVIVELEIVFILIFSSQLVNVTGQSSGRGENEELISIANKIYMAIFKIIFGIVLIFKYIILIFVLNYLLNDLELNPLLMFFGALISLSLFVIHICRNFQIERRIIS